MIATSLRTHSSEAALIATNLRRLMAAGSLTFEEVVQASGLDDRTVRGVALGRNKPHARTLNKLARGLGVSMEDLFRPLGRAPDRRFDRATNMLVENVVAAHAEIFTAWSDADFDELYSRFGTGGQLTEPGILAAAHATNAKRDLLRQISIILESSESELLREFVDLLYRRATETRRPRA